MKELAGDRKRMALLAQNARSFALEHNFESELTKRIESLQLLYGPLSAPAEA